MIACICLSALVFNFALICRADSVILNPIAGSDATGESVSELTSSDISHISSSNDTRMATNSAWPGSGVYDELKYLEFIFNPNLPSDVVIDSISFTHEFRRATILAGAKLEIWDGSAWQNIALDLPPAINTDLSQTIDLTSTLNTINKLNSVKIRFLAYRDTSASSAKTSHDYLGFDIQYATLTPTPTPTTTPTPTPSTTATPDPTPTPIPAPEIPQSTSTPTQTPGMVPLQFLLTPTPTAFPSAIPSPSSAPTVLPTEIILPTPSVSHIAKEPLPSVALRSAKIAQAANTPLPVLAQINLEALASSQPRLFIMNIWHLFTHWLNMVGL